MRRFINYLKLHKKFVIIASIIGGSLAIFPLIILGAYQVVQAVDSNAFCTQVCHDVHVAEAATYQVSPHAEVPCASCHVGAGTGNLVRSKIGGLSDIIPAITRNYPRPIPTPLKDLRPSSETCEKCHSAEKFYGDVPQITTSYAADENNTKSIVTRVLKIGGGREEVAAGIHWHSTATVWYLALDAQRLKIAWIATEDTNGKVTEYTDPQYAAEVTPERIEAEKRLMDCVDCHNRTPHQIESPDKLIDKALADGSIDAGLPFIRLEAVKALVPQNVSLSQAYAKIAAIGDYYRVSYPRVYKEKAAAIDQALLKLKEIAKLTTFQDGLDWNTYYDQSAHDRPDAEMKVNFGAISALDSSPGCFRCHGNLVKVENKAGADTGGAGGATVMNIAAPDSAAPSAVGSAADTGKLDAECSSCHYTLKTAPNSPLSPATSHPIDGLENCLACHSPGAAKPFKTNHPWSTNEACNTCHQSAPKLKSLPAIGTPEEKPINHDVNKLENCLACHGPTGAAPFKSNHPWSTNETCKVCHTLSTSLKVQSSGVSPQSKPVTHPVNKLTDCLACHGPTAAVHFPADHPWSTNETCVTCHQPSPVPLAQPVSAPPQASPVRHPTSGLGDCTSCHNPSGQGPFPADHAGRPESWCGICHKSAGTIAQTPAPLLIGLAIPHSTTGLGVCSSCHNSSGLGLFPANHAGRPDSFCSICHKPGAAATQPSSSSAPAIPHAVDSVHQDCLLCHGPSGVIPVGSTHNGRANSTCVTCHIPSSGTSSMPSAATSLAGTAASVTSVDLTWTDNSGNETGFRVEQATNNAFTANLVTVTVGANTSSYGDTSVAARTTYYYRVFAFNAAGDSGASNTVSVTTPASGSTGGNTPAAPTNLAALAISATQINLTWVDNSSNETGFRIDRATDSAFTAGLVTFTVAGNATAYSDTSVTAGTLYYYRVLATGATGNSTASNTASVTTPASGGGGGGIVAAPASLSAVAISGTQVNLTWVDNASNETGFRIDRATDSAFTAGLVTFTVAANATTYSDTSVTAGTLYYYRVLATGATGNSTASNTASVTTPATVDAAALFATNCARCHGANRQGGAGPALTTTALAQRTVAWLVNFISGHRSGLIPAQVGALAGFLKNTPP